MLVLKRWVGEVVLGVLLATFAAISYGISDYIGGRTARKGSAWLINLISYAVAAIGVGIALPFAVQHGPDAAAIGWGAVAGIASVVGLAIFFYALAGGAMAVVAPINAVIAALFPVVAGIISDSFPSPLASLGVGCALVSIALVSWEPEKLVRKVRARMVWLAVLAGCMFGLFFVVLKPAQSGGEPLWPVFSVEIAGLALAAVVVSAKRIRLRDVNRSMWLGGASVGIIGGGTNLFYLAALNHGSLAVIGPITALYPASTVVLAVLLDRERLHTHQAVGLCFGAGALVLTGMA